MNKIDTLTTLSPLAALLREYKFPEEDIVRYMSQLNRQIEIGAIWSLAKSRGDDLAHLAHFTPEQMKEYLASFSQDEYYAAMNVSAQEYTTDFLESIERGIA
ncbi:MAG TPA: hypothetical protein VGE59_01740 [Patescibacteria group bacterium]